jgi:FtsP/CotA-like multicopper oxidase with cupredoxin domain
MIHLRVASSYRRGMAVVTRCTPPRAATFMYHADVDALREQMAGLMGALIVREPGAEPTVDEHVTY